MFYSNKRLIRNNGIATVWIRLSKIHLFPKRCSNKNYTKRHNLSSKRSSAKIKLLIGSVKACQKDSVNFPNQFFIRFVTTKEK
jgi:hypothetical protein